MLKTKLMVLLSGLLVSASCLSADEIASEEMSEEQVVENSVLDESAVACTEEHCEGKGFDGRILLDNEPTKQVLSSLESLGETLNSLSFLMFAGDKT
ncbi:hypothetical protein D0812_15440 [Vibrio owensii]|uniref:Uncharacterized protein n=1 Tax=Vibrio owensii TaxID=696485 RepID=A0AAP9GEH2_9VIBR|nr:MULTISPECIES: hypothetical protein [Vibrio]AYO15721.1 hypothetical protein D0812_15440 [Vibrio owensii]QGH48337.1 hypothetical protein APZ19_15075 [Vibrio owensii]CAD7816595.1 hypothetical protein ACOMICROBIO_NCLOACGD_03246 [Vibrio sp. B1ASS3]CAE6928875.1 hypothetical protein ACOMICROBIO_NCLOACGD_03246 [Vibrio sp. B1ASS3]